MNSRNEVGRYCHNFIFWEGENSNLRVGRVHIDYAGHHHDIRNVFPEKCSTVLKNRPYNQQSNELTSRTSFYFNSKSEFNAHDGKALPSIFERSSSMCGATIQLN